MMGRRDEVCLGHGGGEHTPGRTRNGAMQCGVDHRGHAALMENARESDQADQSFDGDERDHERERSSVTEAVGYAQPLKGVLRETTPTSLLEHLPRVVTGET